MKDLTVNDPVIKTDGKLTTLGDIGGGTALGGLEFRENPEGTAQYKLPSDDEWRNFSGGGGAPTLLWENSAPESGFIGQDVTVDISNYTHVIIEVAKSGIYGNRENLISTSKKGDNVDNITRLSTYVYNNYIGVRNVFIINNNTIRFQNSYSCSWYEVSGTSNEYACTPIRMYGINLSFE